MQKRELSLRIPFDGTINTRDLGGYSTKDGKTIKYKRLIRTDHLENISEKDAEIFADVYKAKYEVDMRSTNEIKIDYQTKIPSITFIHLPVQEFHKGEHLVTPIKHLKVENKAIQSTIDYLLQMSVTGDMSKAFEVVYRGFLSPFGQKNYAAFLQLCKNNKEGAILFHCSEGKDRSGLAAALLLYCLGVSKEDIIYDYLKTNEYTKEKAQQREDYLRNVANIKDEVVINSIKMVCGVRLNWLEAAFDEIDKIAGDLDTFIRNNLHFSDKDIKELRDNYLE